MDLAVADLLFVVVEKGAMKPHRSETAALYVRKSTGSADAMPQMSQSHASTASA